MDRALLEKVKWYRTAISLVKEMRMGHSSLCRKKPLSCVGYAPGLWAKIIFADTSSWTLMIQK